MTNDDAPSVDRARYRAIGASCVCSQLRRATRALTQAYDAALRPSGLRSTQFTLLATLAATGGESISALGERMGMDRTTLTRNLEPLKRAGLVQTASSEGDRRAKLVRLTPAGEEALARAVPLWERAQASALARLTPDGWPGLLGSVPGKQA
jgi:DNA-binding MarR family transcriptional regulator